jgi:primosomal protein N' (replication factor Y)
VRHASDHDVDSFNREELVYRRAFHYPPAVRMALVRFEATSERAARSAAEAAAAAAGTLPTGVRVRGPAPAPLERLRGQWRWQLLLTAPNRELLRELTERVESAGVLGRAHRVVDVDPLSTL